MEILDYVIISEEGKNKLCNRIKEYIKIGYQPYGPFSISFNENGTVNRFYQALVKVKKDSCEAPESVTID